MSFATHLRRFHLSRSFLIYFAIAQLVILLSNHQLFQEIAATPPGKINLFVHRDWPQDYFSQLAVITQGRRGFWLRYEPYTTEASIPSLLHTYFTMIGKIAAVVPLPPYAAYHAVRISVIEFYIVFLYLVSRAFLGTRFAFWGGIFSLLATFAPRPILHQTIQVSWYPYGYPWWENLDPLERLYMPSHHLFGQAMLLAGIYMTILFITGNRLRNAAISAGAFAIGIFYFPPVLLPILFSAPLALGFYITRRLFQSKGIMLSKIHYFGFFGIALAAVVVSLVLSWQDSQGYVTRGWELNRWNNEPSFLLALPYLFGFLPILVLPAVVRNIMRGKLSELFVTFWAFLPYYLLPFTNLLSLPRIRLLHEAPYVPFGILFAQTVFVMIPHWKKGLLQSVMLLLFFFSTLPVIGYHLYWRVKSVDYFLKTNPLEQYVVSKDQYDSFIYIDKYIPAKSILLADYVAGNMIPAFAPMISYIGHTVNTIDFDSKRFFLVQFYKQERTDDYARDFLRSNSIDYVYFGPYEKAYGGKELTYGFLTEVYTNVDVQIYKVE